MATVESGEIVCYCVGMGLCSGPGAGFGLKRPLMGGLGLLGVDRWAELGIVWTGELWVVFGAAGVRLDVVGGFEAPRLGGWWVYFLWFG